jgi:hypothetical protein
MSLIATHLNLNIEETLPRMLLAAISDEADGDFGITTPSTVTLNITTISLSSAALLDYDVRMIIGSLVNLDHVVYHAHEEGIDDDFFDCVLGRMEELRLHFLRLSRVGRSSHPRVMEQVGTLYAPSTVQVTLGWIEVEFWDSESKCRCLFLVLVF